MKTFTRQSPLSIFLSLSIVVILWIAIAPTQLGGQVSYVIVDGNSMEPTFRFGDLVLVRKQSVYQVGDAVTYQNAEMGRLVFHRIVDIQSERFILQGDHNTWLDNYHPGQSEIIGKLWIHLPAMGKAIQWAREPLGLALVCGLLGGGLMAGFILNPSQPGTGKNKRTGVVSGVWEGALYLTTFIAVAFLGLTIFSFTRPLTRPAEKLQYQQDAQFIYSAPGTPGIYDSATIQPGEPVFPKLTCFLNVGLVYTITGNALQSVSGSHQFYARVSDEKSGWQRTFPLDSETGFQGKAYTSYAGLDLCQVETLVSSVEQQTGLHPGMYTLEVFAHTTVTGTVTGIPMFDSLDSSLKFQFDKVNFHLAAEPTESDPLHTTKIGSISGVDSIPNTLTILDGTLPVQAARVLSMLGLTSSLAGLLLIGWQFLQRTRHNPAEMVRLKYRGLLMDVRNLNLPQNLSFVDVASLDDLARLAERQNTMITHMALHSRHYYYVQVNGTTYRHVLGENQGDASDMEQTQPKMFLPAQIKSNYMDAIPVDNLNYSFRVDLRHIRPAQTDQEETVVLQRVKL